MGITQLEALNRLKELRKEKGLTLRALAGMVDMSPISLCRFEKGERILLPEYLSAICDVFGLSKNEKADILFAFGYMEAGNS